MKETIGTTQTFQYVLIFTLVIVAFLTLSLTYNKVYRLKNETISILEKYEGASSKSLGIINDYLTNSGYSETGKCGEGETGYMLNENASSSDGKYNYCLKYKTSNGRIYYTIRLFFKFNLPVIGELFTFGITGETGAIKIAD